MFIPLAEQVGAIHALGEHALRTSVTALADWIDEARGRRGTAAPGDGGRQPQPAPAGPARPGRLVREVLEERQLAPYRLVLEITEEALLDDWETAVQVIRELRALGVAVAVDDFGTGYSSLRYLRRFETSTVKVDREFVQAVADEPRTRALVAQRHGHGARRWTWLTVAEGIETLDQLPCSGRSAAASRRATCSTSRWSSAAFGELALSRHRYPMTGYAVPEPAASRHAPDQPATDRLTAATPTHSTTVAAT